MYIQSPAPFPNNISTGVFIGGGISNCPRWQDEIADLLIPTNHTIFNPRRVGDLAKDGDEAAQQIEWEYKALDLSTILLFWFPKESVCPITLFEYGKALAWAERGFIRKLIVGRDPEYPRVFDLDTQTAVDSQHSRLWVASVTNPRAQLFYTKSFDEFKDTIKTELL